MTAPDLYRKVAGNNTGAAPAKNAGIGTVVEGHGFTDCRKTGAWVQHCGRAALQGIFTASRYWEAERSGTLVGRMLARHATLPAHAGIDSIALNLAAFTIHYLLP